MRALRRSAAGLALGSLACGALLAQDSREATLADMRQELNVLFVEIQRLKRELSTTGGPPAPPVAGTLQGRIDAIEGELARVTGRVEALEFRVDRIVRDGTNRIGDLEFRIVELEGGDVGALGDTTTLGGEDLAALPAPGPAAAPSGGLPAGPELAANEQADFDAATVALSEQDYSQAANLFGRFNETYPGSPLAAQAQMGRGAALENLGDLREAARAYLAAFQTDPDGNVAPEGLYRLGRTLGLLSQITEACVTLGEVGARFPGDPSAGLAEEERQGLGCD